MEIHMDGTEHGDVISRTMIHPADLVKVLEVSPQAVTMKKLL